MGTRIQLHEKLLANFGDYHVYYQPPPTIKMEYPAIVYSLSNIRARHADDRAYLGYKRYTIIFIHRDPDVDHFDDMTSAFSMCSFERRYVADNLYHDVYGIFY